jgi:heparosan-N-sulfate-glucuronate 5-epimerase
MTLPMGMNVTPGELGGYHIDFSLKPESDPSWPPTWVVGEARGRDILEVATVQWIAQWGLGCFERHLSQPDGPWLDAALQASAFLWERQERGGPLAGAWFNGRPMAHTFRLDPPWISGMAQGEAASLLARAYSVTDDERFRDAALLALGPFRVPTERGGVRATLGDGFFLEEYPTQPASCVLNGGIFALWGLHDVAVGLDDEAAKREFADGVDTLAANIHRWDTGSWSRYDLFPFRIPNVASGAYHVLHMNQLRAMQRIAPRPQFPPTVERFEAYLGSRSKRLAAFARKAAFRILVPRNRVLARRSPFARPAASRG